MKEPRRFRKIVKCDWSDKSSFYFALVFFAFTIIYFYDYKISWNPHFPPIILFFVSGLIFLFIQYFTSREVYWEEIK